MRLEWGRTGMGFTDVLEFTSLPPKPQDSGESDTG